MNRALWLLYLGCPEKSEHVPYAKANFCKKLEKRQEKDCLGAPKGSGGCCLEESTGVGNGDLTQAEPAESGGGCDKE